MESMIVYTSYFKPRWGDRNIPSVLCIHPRRLFNGSGLDSELPYANQSSRSPGLSVQTTYEHSLCGLLS